MIDGLGETAASGNLKTTDLADAMAASGTTLPQVSATGGMLNATWQVVTSDGTCNNKEGECFAVLDTTGTGTFSKGTQLVANTPLVGNGQGNVVQRALAAIGLMKRATNVGVTVVSTIPVRITAEQRN